MHSSSANPLRVLNLFVAALLPLLFSSLLAASPAPAKFRDFKIYTTSAPDPADAARIVATMQCAH